MENIFAVILMLASLIIVVSVTMQDPKTDGLGTLTGQETNVFGRSAHRTKNEMLDKVVIAGGVLLFLGSIIMLAVM
ncbi:preprotein translocase subunit SecG [Anaerococcus sp. Marseille-Q5996]|uniref:Protein-export membrane protein SecG n=1 Tax=Anaerococcus martiniensis TaxID=3115615 RepID=A0ABW9M5I8_9FIRM|nr:preprotein translocase subunit SecG [Anaerococcus sp. Marseille-Q5996]